MTTEAVNIRIGVLAGEARAELARLNTTFERVIRKIGLMSHAWVSWQGAAAGVRGMVHLADSMQKLDARMRGVVESGEAFAEAKSAVTAIALQTGESIDRTVDSYIKLATAVKVAGGNQQQAIGIMSSLSDALDVNDASAAASTAVFAALSKAITQGVVGTRDLNTLVKQSPRALQALADGLGVPVERLWEMAKAGELTAEVIGRSLISQMSRLRAESAAMPPVVGEATENLRTHWARYVDDLNGATGGTRKLAATIQFVAEHIGTLMTGALSMGAAALAVWTTKAVAAAIAARSLSASLAATAIQGRVLIAGLTSSGAAAAASAVRFGVLSRALAALGGWPGLIAGALAAAIPAWAAWSSAGERAADAVGDALDNANQRAARSGRTQIEELDRQRADLEASIKSYQYLVKTYQDAAASVPDRNMGGVLMPGSGRRKFKLEIDKRDAAQTQMDTLLKELRTIEAAIKEAKEKQDRLNAQFSPPGGGVDPPSTAELSAAASRDKDLAQLKTRIEQQEALYERGKTGEAAYIEVKRQFAQQEISIEEARQHALLQAASQSNAPDAAEKAAAARAALAVLTEQRKQIDIQAASDQEQRKRESEARITAIEADGLRERGALVEAALLDWDQKNALHLERLRAQGAAGLAELSAMMTERARVEAKAWEEQIVAAVESATGRLDALRTRLDKEVNVDMKSRAQAESELRTETVALAREIGDTLIPQLEALIALEPNPEKLARLKQYLADLRGIQQAGKDAEAGPVFGGLRQAAREYIDETSDLFGQMRDVGRNAFRGIEDALVDMAMTGKANFKELANSIIADIMRIVIRQSLIQPIERLLGGGGGGGGGLLSIFGKVAGAFGALLGGGGGTTIQSGNLTSGFELVAAKGAVVPGGIGDYHNEIVQRPTVFAFARGGVPRTGLMGEAGPEAVMPLDRDPSGRLGVRAALSLPNLAPAIDALAARLSDAIEHIAGVLAPHARGFQPLAAAAARVDAYPYLRTPPLAIAAPAATPHALRTALRERDPRDTALVRDAPAPSMTVNVINQHPGARIEQREAQDSRGNRRVDIVVGEAAAVEAARPGSTLNRAIRGTFGLTPAMIPRG